LRSEIIGKHSSSRYQNSKTTSVPFSGSCGLPGNILVSEASSFAGQHALYFGQGGQLVKRRFAIFHGKGIKNMKQWQKNWPAITINLGLGLAALALAQQNIGFFINNQASSDPAIVVGGKTYVSVNALKAAGLDITASSGRVDLKLVGNSGNSNTVQSQSQLAGSDGKIGTLYSIGQRSPLAVNLASTEFSVMPVAIGANKLVPNGEQKLVIVRFSVQNPQKTDVEFSSRALRFTLSDEQSATTSPDPNAGLLFVAREGDVMPFQGNLKPAQKLNVYAVLVVSGAANINKLILQRAGEANAPVVRYAITPRGLSAPIAGAAPYIALSQVNGQLNTYYPSSEAEIKLESAGFSATERLNQLAPSSGKRWLVLNFAARNPFTASGVKVAYGPCFMSLALTDQNDERQSSDYCNTPLFRPSRDERFSGELNSGEEVRFRIGFQVANTANIESLTLQVGRDGRSYRFDLSSVR
jgi:hypothetical protein